MDNGNDASTMIVFLGMGFLSFIFCSILIVAGTIYLIHRQKKDNDTSTSGGGSSDEEDTDQTSKTGVKFLYSKDKPGTPLYLPRVAENDLSEDCVYMYESGAPGWTSESTESVNKGEWCLSDGKLGERIHVNDLKRQVNQNADNKSMEDKLDYLRIGNNIDLQVFSDVDDTQGKMFRGSEHGNQTVVDLDDHDGWVNNIYSFKINHAR